MCLLYKLYLPYVSHILHCGIGILAKSEDGLLNQINCSWIEILNYYLNQISGYKIREDCERIEGRLRRLCGQVASKYVGENGTTFRKLNLNVVNISVCAGEFQTTEELAFELKKEQAKKEQMYKENEILKSRCQELYGQMRDAQKAETMPTRTYSRPQQTLTSYRPKIYTHISRTLDKMLALTTRVNKRFVKLANDNKGEN